jgi:shikimate dehydrogenase
LSGQSEAADRYGLVGHPVAHSHSPVIHRLFAEQTGEHISYELIDATEDEFETAVLGFRAAGGKGLNVTVPHKYRAVQIARQRGPEAEAAQAANTLSFSSHLIKADNTDGIGLVKDLTENLGLTLDKKKILILGAGGAARGIIGPLCSHGAVLSVANRTLSRATELQHVLAEHAEFRICRFDDLDDIEEQDVIINATSAGVKGEDAPFPGSIFTSRCFCYDLSYSLKDTPFVNLARSHGAGRAVQGWGMLVEQAAESFKIWRGMRPETADILKRLRR